MSPCSGSRIAGFRGSVGRVYPGFDRWGNSPIMGGGNDVAVQGPLDFLALRHFWFSRSDGDQGRPRPSKTQPPNGGDLARRSPPRLWDRRESARRFVLVLYIDGGTRTRSLHKVNPSAVGSRVPDYPDFLSRTWTRIGVLGEENVNGYVDTAHGRRITVSTVHGISRSGTVDQATPHRLKRGMTGWKGQRR